MQSVLITGVSGFVGRHLTRRLLDSGLRVTGFDRSGASYEALRSFLGPQTADRVKTLQCDLADSASLADLFSAQTRDFDAIVHLAGISFPPIGWKDPALVLDANVRNTISLLQAAREAGWRGRFLLVSSSDVYGRVPDEAMPIDEGAAVRPDNPYGASKAASELFAQCLGEDGRAGIEVLVARPFNHIGPGQAEEFVLPAFLKRIREGMARGDTEIETGDLESARDFTDVRDVVQAYEVLLRRGVRGHTYNICSGRLTRIGQLLEMALEVAEAKLRVRVNPDLLRPDGRSVRYGTAAGLNALGWQPTFSLEQTVRDTYEWMCGGTAP